MRIERRTAARGLLLTPASQVLLLDTDIPWLGRAWMVPGGGVEGDETPREAAAREVYEETGLQDAPIGPEVWWRNVRIDFADYQMRMIEHFFLIEVAEFTPSREQFQPEERTSLLEQRWWHIGELATSRELSAPAELAMLLADLVRDGPPARTREIASVSHIAHQPVGS
jgi:8-oxo-dGTP pyrophosphatase MutT (NUDIX family)